MKSGRGATLVDYLLLLPGVGYIIFFIAAAVVVTVLQSVGLFSIIGGSHFPPDSGEIFGSEGGLDFLVFFL